MNSHRLTTIVSLVAFVTASGACETRPTANRNAAATAVRREVNLALQRYADAARAVDANGSIEYFASNGVLFEPGIPPACVLPASRPVHNADASS